MTAVRKTVSVAEMNRLLRALAEKHPGAFRRAMQASVRAMVADAKKNKLSGQYLGVVTGAARRSIKGRVAGRTSKLLGSIGSHLRYVRAHEEGFRGTVGVRAHARRKPSGGYTNVRAHTRRMNIKARRFLRDTVREEARGRKSPFRRRVAKSLAILAATGRLARVKQLLNV